MALLSEPERDRDGRGRGRGVLVAAAALVLLAVATGGWWALHRGAPRQTLPRPGRATAATPAPGLATGRVEIESRPAGARVSVDGRDLGAAPQRVDLPGGSHQLLVLERGFEPFAREIHVVPGHTLRLAAELDREAPRLRVDADLPGASVFLDHKLLGRTPLETPVTPGSHRLNVTTDGYDMYSDTIEIDSGTREVSVRFKEVRLDEAIEVVHKHGVGSCRGRLLATPAGLRYETDDPRDGFSAPFSRLEPLQVDYLGRNLRVKVEGGRTYNFTARPDTLLAFRNAVEAVRKRL